MRNAISFLGLAGLAGLLVSGCTGPESKLGRGVSNVSEVVRGGELRSSMEQTAVFDSPDAGYTTGFIRGLDHSLARTGMGIYEVVSFPFPPYHPVLTRYVAPEPVYPDNYQPALVSDSLFDTDTYVGFNGGDIAPLVPGSRFHVFDN
jgi:putative exosortase-associated protein (TIGR04073 family)